MKKKLKIGEGIEKFHSSAKVKLGNFLRKILNGKHLGRVFKIFQWIFWSGVIATFLWSFASNCVEGGWYQTLLIGGIFVVGWLVLLVIACDKIIFSIIIGVGKGAWGTGLLIILMSVLASTYKTPNCLPSAVVQNGEWSEAHYFTRASFWKIGDLKFVNLRHAVNVPSDFYSDNVKIVWDYTTPEGRSAIDDPSIPDHIIRDFFKNVNLDVGASRSEQEEIKRQLLEKLGDYATEVTYYQRYFYNVPRQ